MKNLADMHVYLDRFQQGLKEFRTEVINGLQKQQKEVPMKYFYDQKGSSGYLNKFAHWKSITSHALKLRLWKAALTRSLNSSDRAFFWSKVTVAIAKKCVNCWITWRNRWPIHRSIFRLSN